MKLSGSRSPWLAVALGITWFASVRTAHACGVSASGVSSCSLAEHDEATRARWAVGVSGLYTATRLRFSGSLYAEQVRGAVLASLAYLPTPRLVLQLGAGAALGGSLTAPDGKHTFSPGPIAALGLDYRAFDDGRYFLVLTSGLSFTAAQTQRSDDPTVGYEALDLRIGAQLGVQLANIVRPYVVTRAFGGPVFWRNQGKAVTGTDTHHYQVGLGTGVNLTKKLNLFAEGIPFGERAVSAGLGFSL